MNKPVSCLVYRSAQREFTYLYLRADLDFDDLPEQLRQVFGRPEKVLELELDEERRLAQEDVVEVITSLEKEGYHLQLPPSEDESGWLDLPKR